MCRTLAKRKETNFTISSNKERTDTKSNRSNERFATQGSKTKSLIT